MKNIVKFENGKIILDTEGLRVKQRRNVMALIQQGETSGALDYAAALAQHKRMQIRNSALRNLRDNRQFAAASLHKPKKDRIWNLFAKRFNVAHTKSASVIPYGKAIGVEIEFFMPRGSFESGPCGECSSCEDGEEFDCSDTTSGLGAAREFFTKICTQRRIKGINIGEDGSIDCDEDEYIALEARVLTNIDDTSNLEAFLKVLNEQGAEVNKSCGLHVHLDFRDYERRPSTVVSKLEAALPLLRAIVPPSRVKNRYCANDVGSTSSETGTDRRYSAINDVEAFNKFKTIEVRLHSGTVNFTKIKNWINILYSIARSEGKPADNSIEAYASKFSWSASLVAYIVTRIRKFNPDHVLLGGSKELPNSDQLIIDSSFEESEAA